jgi:septal ring factor EnvC (AmiA/AmiB activator)
MKYSLLAASVLCLLALAVSAEPKRLQSVQAGGAPAAAVDTHQPQIDELKAKLAALETKVNGIEARQNGMESRLAVLETKLGALSQVDVVKVDIAALKKQVADLEASLKPAAAPAGPKRLQSKQN